MISFELYLIGDVFARNVYVVKRNVLRQITLDLTCSWLEHGQNKKIKHAFKGKRPLEVKMYQCSSSALNIAAQTK